MVVISKWYHKSIFWTALLTFVSLFTHCNNVNNSNLSQNIIAEIINPDNYADKSRNFTIYSTAKIHIVGVGEALYNLAENEKKYYLKPDAIEMTFHNAKFASNCLTNRKINTKPITSNIDIMSESGTGIKKIICRTASGYDVELAVPWNRLDITCKSMLSGLSLNFAVIDNDDHIVQKTKIALSSRLSYIRFGNESTEIKSDASKNQPAKIFAARISPSIDGLEDNLWKKAKTYTLKKLAFGQVKDQLDLSASIRLGYDGNYLYSYIRVIDNNVVHRVEPEIFGQSLLTDYGWIEDEAGKMVWKMTILGTTWGGGALKNRLVDTMIHLKPGNYILRYLTDESHAYNNWETVPPLQSFYGIKVTQLKF